MAKLPNPEEKATPHANLEVCPICRLPVDLTGECWLRISPRKARINAFHLGCWDSHAAAVATTLRASIDFRKRIEELANVDPPATALELIRNELEKA